MRKEMINVFGRKYFLLGKDSDGRKYWMQELTFNFGLFWSGGCVETYKNNCYPENQSDVESRKYFEELFLKRSITFSFKSLLVETPFSDEEIWKILELMNSFYIARRYADMVDKGGTAILKNPCAEIIKNKEHCDHINKVLIPEIAKELYKILGGE